MTPEKLRELYGEPSPRAAAKEITHFDKHCVQFIAHSTFVVLATSNGEDLDVSPKGDTAGFIRVEDNKTLLLPDRPGNNRIDGLINIISNPKVALIFLIPAVAETLRVNGTASITDDAVICQQFEVKGRLPKTVIRITAEQIFTHCGKAPIRAGLWQPDTWPQSRPIPTLNEMVRDHSEYPVDSIEQSAVDKMYEGSLY